MTTTRVRLSRIIRFLERTDAGEYGATICPHCDAKGRYVHHFICEDGVRRGAMSGCVKLFPVSPVAEVEGKLQVKAEKYAKDGWKLPSWDNDKLAAIDLFYAGQIDEMTCLLRIQIADANARNYRASKGRRY